MLSYNFHIYKLTSHKTAKYALLIQISSSFLIICTPSSCFLIHQANLAQSATFVHIWHHSQTAHTAYSKSSTHIQKANITKTFLILCAKLCPFKIMFQYNINQLLVVLNMCCFTSSLKCQSQSSASCVLVQQEKLWVITNMAIIVQHNTINLCCKWYTHVILSY